MSLNINECTGQALLQLLKKQLDAAADKGVSARVVIDLAPFGNNPNGRDTVMIETTAPVQYGEHGLRSRDKDNYR